MSEKPDMQRLVGDILRPGRIASVDHGAQRCTVTIGDMTTGPLPWLAMRAGKLRIWSPPSIGEQCILLCAEGDTNSGFVLPALYCDAFPAPFSSPDIVALQFEDGSAISYDMAARALNLDLVGAATLNVPDGLTINADISLNGTLSTPDDVVAGGKSLKGHVHSGVQGGTGQTGGPV
ncbi:MAG TPA: phage baseplate assembly protein V [Sphingobium sp.]|uniref:phage baseplate assembly protein V n=1 Tax=Sphingobium sp. TaxID=1912891 RepID=UPI002ED33386